MCIRKGREYLTIFADLKGKAVLFATEGKDKETWDRFIAEWEKHEGHRHQLLQVSMDMSKAYRAAVPEWCRNAVIVFDKYHVVAHVNAAVDQVRKYEIRYGPWSVREALKRTMWIWRKNRENLTENERQRLAGIEHKNLWTAKAYQMRLVFQDIYRSATAEEVAVVAEKRAQISADRNGLLEKSIAIRQETARLGEYEYALGNPRALQSQIIPEAFAYE